MIRSFDEQLKHAIARVEPPDGFAERVLQAFRKRTHRKMGYSMAAAGLTVLLAVGGIEVNHVERHRRAERTEHQAIFALSLTAEKVNQINMRLQKSARTLEIAIAKEGNL